MYKQKVLIMQSITFDANNKWTTSNGWTWLDVRDENIDYKNWYHNGNAQRQPFSLELKMKRMTRQWRSWGLDASKKEEQYTPSFYNWHFPQCGWQLLNNFPISFFSEIEKILQFLLLSVTQRKLQKWASTLLPSNAENDRVFKPWRAMAPRWMLNWDVQIQCGC